MQLPWMSTRRWMVAVALVALVLSATARYLRSKQAGGDGSLGVDQFSGRLAGARLSQQEAIHIAENTYRGRGADPGRCKVGWVRARAAANSTARSMATCTASRAEEACRALDKSSLAWAWWCSFPWAWCSFPIAWDLIQRLGRGYAPSF